ncbi:hypothetical protein TrRE_jg8064 [Triparma retinervis]|uniref:Uncharacterized protein n=1 Tax=Triparma retinervis TaxID=2557542 RepID=A0A9W7CAD4_9STRA|nr:hypothetical protein TrRE_jg8064 [Triparma retinervis]
MTTEEIQVSGNDAIDDLLAFYRFRVAEFEKERELHLNRVDMIEPQKEELHRLRWEAKARDSELVELRKTVSDAQISVHQERETANDQGAMILRLKQQQVEDRKRIQRLLALTQPVVGDITFIQEGSEDAGGALAEQYQVALNNAENAMSKKHSNGILSAQAVASRLQARNESLQLTIDSLKDQLDSYKGIARDKISTLYEDRNIREQQFQKTTESLMSKVELLTKKLNATEDNLNAVTKDYLVLRHNAQVAQRVMVEEKQLLRAEREALEHDRKSAARQMSLEMAAAREASQAEIELATTDFRGQVQARERDMAVLREQYENIQGVYSARVRDLEQQLELYKHKYTSLNRRRKLEIQGSAAAATLHKQEVKSLRRSIRSRARTAEGGMVDPTLLPIADDGSSNVDLNSEEEDDELLEENMNPNTTNDEGDNSTVEVAYLKERVSDMETQLKRLLAVQQR